MNDTNFIKGRTIKAMQNDNISVTEMLTLMGVDPKPEIVDLAIAKFAANGGQFTMTDVGKFLMDEGVLTRMVCSDLR